MSSHPSVSCDVILKGGITSGIVYPHALTRLSRMYRFRRIGGTSAGAIAAGLAAAAELGRAKGGFELLEQLPAAMRTQLPTLFQPSPGVRQLFTLLRVGGIQRRWLAAVGPVIAGFWLRSAIALAIGAGLVLAVRDAGWLPIALAALLSVVLLAILLALGLARQILRTIPAQDYGICPGTTQDAGAQGLSDWMADLVDRAAGIQGRPLTFGDLWAGPDDTGTRESPVIDLRMMTTNLTLRRPNELPFLDSMGYGFRPEELRRVLPDRIVDHMVSVTSELRDGVYRFPRPEDLPVVVAMRMSLSFPLLISAVPLWWVNHAAGRRLERVLFSDGGLSSNLPLHFFDALLPSRPTFGISLEPYIEEVPSRRVYLPMPARAGRLLQAHGIAGLPAFAMALLDAAKDWQDTLLARLPGYRERVVRIHLRDGEGGLNLDMNPELVESLAAYGGRAGAVLAGGPPADPADRHRFDFDDHRWRRFLVAFAAVEELLEDTAKAWGDPGSGQGFHAFVRSVLAEPPSYGRPGLEWRRQVYERFESIMAVARSWGPALRHEQGGVPRPRFGLRITPALSGPGRSAAAERGIEDAPRRAGGIS